MTVQGAFVFIWILLGVLSIIGVFKKGKFWFLPFFLLVGTMFVGYWFDKAYNPPNGLWGNLNSGTHFGVYTQLLATLILILETLVFFGNLLLGKFKEQDRKELGYEIGNKLILLIVTSFSVYMIWSVLMQQ